MTGPDTPSGSHKSHGRRRFTAGTALFWLRLAIGALLLAAVFSLRASLNETLRLLMHAHAGWLVAGLFVSFAGEALTSLKWKWLLDGIGQRIGAWQAIGVSLVGMFYNNFLPGSVGGDIVRIVAAARAAGGKAEAAASVFLQRNTGMGALLAIALISCMLQPVQLQLFPARLWLLNSLPFWFSLVAAAYLLANVVLFSSLVCRWLGKLAIALSPRPDSGHLRKAAHYAVAKALRLHESMIRFRPGIALAVAVSLVTQMIDCLLVYICARAVGLELGFLYCCMFGPAVSLAALVPVSVNGIGLREAAYLALLASVNVVPAQAVGISVLYFAYITLLALVGGLLHWLSPAHRIGE